MRNARLRVCHRPSSFAATLTLLALAGCGGWPRMVRDAYVAAQVCPEDRVTVTARDDLHTHDFTESANPPPEVIASDPGRLAIWREVDAEHHAWDTNPVYEAVGCGTRVFYSCTSGGRHGRDTCTALSASRPPS